MSASLHDNTIDLAERVRLIRDGLISGSGYVVAITVGFILVPIMLKKLGAEAYGLWIALLAVMGIIGACDFGLGSSLSREVAAVQGGKAKEGVQRFVGAVGQLYLGFGAVGFLLFCILAIPLGKLFILSEETQRVTPVLFVLFGAAFCGDQLVLFVTAVLGGLRKFRTINYLSIVFILLRATGIVVFLNAEAGLIALAVWYAVVSMIAAVVALWVLRRIEPCYGLELSRFEFAAIDGHASFAIGSTLTTIMGSLVWTVAPLLIGAVNGAAWVAWYHIGQKFPLALSSVYRPMTTVLFSAASEYSQRDNVAATRELIETGTRWIMGLVLPLCLILWIMAPRLLSAWVGDVGPETVSVFRLTAVAVCADALGATALQILWGQGKVRKILVVLSVMMVANIGLTSALLPLAGIIGAAWALCASVMVGSLALFLAVTAACGIRGVTVLRSIAVGTWFPLLICGTVTAAVLPFCTSGSWVEIIALIAVSLTGYLVSYYWTCASNEDRATVCRVYDEEMNLIKGALRFLRDRLRRFSFLRSGWYLAAALRARGRHDPDRNREIFNEVYAGRPDPWGYDTAWGQEHLATAQQLLDDVRGQRPFQSAFEIGCGDGRVTEMVAPRCRALLATDISDVALAKARERCGKQSAVYFKEWNILRDPVPGVYDLVLAMGVLEVFLTRRDLCTARSKIIESLMLGGHLLITTTKQHSVIEGAWWGRWIAHGSHHINAFLLRSGHLQICGNRDTDTHRLTIYRKISNV